MVGSDDVLACFIAGNTFTWEYDGAFSRNRYSKLTSTQ